MWWQQILYRTPLWHTEKVTSRPIIGALPPIKLSGRGLAPVPHAEVKAYAHGGNWQPSGRRWWCDTGDDCRRDARPRFTFLRRHSDTSPSALASPRHTSTSKSPPPAAAAAAAAVTSTVSVDRLQLWAQSMERLLADDCEFPPVVCALGFVDVKQSCLLRIYISRES